MLFIPDDEMEAEGGMEVETGGLLDYITRLYDCMRGVPRKQEVYETPSIVKEIENQIITEDMEEMESMKKRAATQIEHQKDVVMRYVGNLSPKERKELFLSVFGMDSTLAIETFRNSLTQNPYRRDSWYSPEEITQINMNCVRRYQVNKEMFSRQYIVNQLGKRDIQSLTMPTLFLVEPTQKTKFHDILYGSDDLVMKVTPLFNAGGIVSRMELDQVYNEIKAAYFLNELVYGYQHVLSIHFMCIVDWFQTTRKHLELPKNPLTDPLLHQIVIAERAHKHLNEFLLMHNTLDTLRVTLFQILHALETAWHTNHFTHNDMHMGNVMMRDVSHDGSPFRDRRFIYKRLDRDRWYVLDNQYLHNHIVKLIDFGQSRLYVPKSARHVAITKHVHSDLIGLDMPAIGLPLGEANRQIDMRSLFMTLLMMPDEYWDRLGKEESEEVFTFIERDVLDFTVINRLIDKVSVYHFGDLVNERRVYGAGKLRASNLRKCPRCIRYLTSNGIFRYANTRTGANVTQVLDSDFFESLTIVPEGETEKTFSVTKTPHKYVVVSFIGDENIRMHDPANSLAASVNQEISLRCDVCRKKASFVNHEKTGHTVPLCGPMCAQFKYLFGNKTVLR